MACGQGTERSVECDARDAGGARRSLSEESALMLRGCLVAEDMLKGCACNVPMLREENLPHNAPCGKEQRHSSLNYCIKRTYDKPRQNVN